MPVLTASPTARLPRHRPRFAPPPPPPAPALELPVVSFFGRTLAEYVKFFALDLDALRGCDVLDVAAGPSSFTAEACARRIDAVALDPLYAGTPAALASRIDDDYARMFAMVRAHARLFRLKSFPTFAAAEADRRLAADRFLADYAVHQSRGRYVAAALPHLPFFDRTFDLVLCAHLLFLHAQFDFQWHLAACRELVRVSADEVRLHPVCGANGKPYPQLGALRRELHASGISSELVDVDYEFFAGSDSMLVLRRAQP